MHGKSPLCMLMKMGIIYYISSDDFKAGSDSKTFNASRQSFESFALDQEIRWISRPHDDPFFVIECGSSAVISSRMNYEILFQHLPFKITYL